MNDILFENLKMFQHDDRLFQVEEFKDKPNSVVLRLNETMNYNCSIGFAGNV